MSLAGCYLFLQGAIYTDRLIVQNLCDPVYFGRDNIFDAPSLWKLTHLFECLVHLINGLATYYARLADQLANSVLPRDLPALLEQEPDDDHERFAPAATCVRDEDGKPIHLKYGQTLRKDTWGTTYRAQTDTGKTVVVKFVQQYGIDAHRYLANLGYAPQVLYFGNVYPDTIKRPLRPRMVIMEYIDGESAFTATLTASQCLALRDAITVMHEQNFVHGDLRPPNVHIGKDGKVYVLDFDWAGLVGKAFYPFSLAENNDWPLQVNAHLNDMLPVTKEHDIYMLDRLVGPFECAAAAVDADSMLED